MSAPKLRRAVTAEVRLVSPDDPLAQPLLADLEREYDSRYGSEVFGEPASTELNRYPAALFRPPSGGFLVLLVNGVTVSGGALMRSDERTAELKRIWTHPDWRGQGLARRTLGELEALAARLGYDRVYLTTGPRQPEAVALYLSADYTPLFDVSRSAAEIGVHPFTKDVVRGSEDTAAPPDRFRARQEASQ